ncbi:MAG: hypothetical protein KatS3mg013_1813 [Actinomycetota bacterium]|jgi:multiple sugar transport system substrate-binding protein|nr:MAG: hypothetical protein KatS3mg013_1813 [Actinomycetota bacterium]
MDLRRGRRRIAAPIALFVGLVLVAVACGGGGDGGGGGGGERAACPEPDPNKDTLSLFLIPSPSAEAIKSFIPEFEQETGIKVSVEEVEYGSAHQKQLLSYQQQEGKYDVAQFDNTFLAPFGYNKVMMPLDGCLAESEEYDINDFSKGQQDYGKYEGVTYGLTLSTEPMLQWYRTDIYEKLGLEPATTWEEYYDNAKAVEDSGLGDGQIVGFGPNVSWWWMTLVWSFGGQLYDENLEPQVTSPEAVEATEYLKSLLEVAPAGAISATGDDVTNKFLSQDVGAMIQYSGYYGIASDPANTDFVGKFALTRMPSGGTDITHLAGWNIGIPADSQNQGNAWRFLEFVLGKSNAKEFLKRGAAAIGRISITTDPELLKEQPYLELLTIPDTSRIERYPQLVVWPEMDKAIVDNIQNILSGQIGVEEGLEQLNEQLAGILANEPR